MSGESGQSDAGGGRLPELGPAARRWLALRSVEDAGLDEALGLLNNDALLREPVLSWCRGLAGPSAARVTTPHRAVIIVGVPGVRTAVVAVSSVMALGGMNAAGPAIDPDGYWTHALGVGAMCERLALAAGDIDPDEAALAGLLHDAGKALLAADMPEAFAQAMELAERRARPTSVALREVLGIDHHTVAKRLAEAWRLPAAVRDALWLHGQPPEAMPASADRRLAGLVSLAKAWARTNHLGWSGEHGAPGSVADLCRAVGIEETLVERAVGPVLETVRDRARALGLVQQGAGVDPLAWSAAAASRKSDELAARLREVTNASERSRRLLGAIEAFHKTVRLEDEPTKVIGAIGRSACDLLGVGRVAIVWQTPEARDWSLTLVGASGQAERSRRVERPPDGAQIRRPADLARAHASQVLIACELGWLAKLLEHLREAGTPALVGAGAVGDDPGASCLVLAPVPRAGVDTADLEPVSGVWAWALEASSRAASAVRLGEELAQTNRALAETRDELASKESMVRLGRMAAGAAHELNNPLTVIRGRAQLISEKASTPRQREDADAIAEAARQVSDMVTSLHLLSSPPSPRPADCDPMLVLRDAIDRARSSVPPEAQKTRVRINADGAVSIMHLDAELAAQALAEPIANAMLARPGGEVHISIESEAFSDRLRVRVIDRGPGLSDRALTHAFDPFYSEQPAGRRAGLGLARTRSLVDLMGGSIELANNPGDIGGAYAEIILPQAEARKRAA
ncbi:MAG: HDOD domain-containing protein [Phycisphaerales bacterium]|nr:HDOD domain-containing protein [Planctomycetota bacterium]MCH8509361.1 HDOD domain-containing protein [Phycisphaerales bacterium]